MILASSKFRKTVPLSETLEGNAPVWTHIVPKGEWDGVVEIPAGYDVEGYGVVEEAMAVDGMTVFDDSVMERLVQGYEDGQELLIDYDHLSHDLSKKTEASGWGQGVRYNAGRDGLELLSDWTAPARQEIKDKVYRFISPEFAGTVKYANGIFRFYPTRLTGAGLTNRPKLTALSPVSANRTKQTTMNYKAVLLSLLSLSETATEDEIKAKIDGRSSEDAESKNRATRIADLEKTNKTLSGLLLDSDLEQFADVIGEEDKETAKELFIHNRDTAVKIYGGIRERLAKNKEPRQPIYQKNRATPPDGKGFLGDGEEDKEAYAKFRAVESRAHAISKDRGIPFSQGFDAAKAEAGI